MNEATRLEIVQRRQQGASVRSIAMALGISRGAVDRVLARVEAQRTGSSPSRQTRREMTVRLLRPATPTGSPLTRQSGPF